MTRESIRGDLQALWMAEKPMAVFVTHSIEEAVQLSSRVFIITPQPVGSTASSISTCPGRATTP